MRIITIALLVTTVTSPALSQTITVASGIKSENQRPNGGVIISDNPVALLDMKIVDDSGIYGRIWSTTGSRADTEVRVSGGISKACFGQLTCRVELGYWATPDISKSNGDIIALSTELSGKYVLSNRSSLSFSTQAEYLRIQNRPDSQILRADIGYTRTIRKVPMRFQIGYAYNVRPNWLHMPLALSVAIPVSKKFTMTPLIEVLIPLNQRNIRRDGVAFGITFTYRSW